MTTLHLSGVGLIGPGMPGWPGARQVLRGEQEFDPTRLPQPDAAMLPANERRRAAASVRWALAAAHEAASASGYRPDQLATVFAASGSDGETLHHLCEVLASPARDVSPTRFHNSVHNAAAGYWHIAAASTQPSVSLCAYDASFGAGLVEAAGQARAERLNVLLVACDLPYPPPLYAVRPIARSLAVALVLTPAPQPATLARLQIAVTRGTGACTPLPAMLPADLASNPVAAALPLLASVALGRQEAVRVPYLDRCQLVVEATPWP